MSEKIYDTQIAPVLKQLADLCREHDMNLIAMCQFDGEQSGITMQITKPNISEHLIRWAIESRGNLDSLVIKASRFVADEKSRHNSMVLKLLEQDR